MDFLISRRALLQLPLAIACSEILSARPLDDQTKEAPMLESLDNYQGSQAEQTRICAAFDAALNRTPGPKGDSGLVDKAEGVVAQDPSRALVFDSAGVATLTVGDRELIAGRFACRSLGSLAESLPQPSAGSRLSLFVLVGNSAITDIGALQGSAPARSAFQAASQFNCLESPGAYLAPVAHYLFDPTQGPRASISAFPGTLLRHYSAPGESGRFVQKDPSPQLNLLHRLTQEGVAQVKSGYLLAHNIEDPKAFASLLKERFSDIEVGVHEGVEVVLGANWDGPVQGRPMIGQVFTSTLAAGGYSRVDFQDTTWLLICRQLQRAAYLGTLLAAAATGQRRVVLTLIGGGVFANPTPVIWDSIVWACRQVQPRLAEDLTVIVNGRDLGGLDLAEVKSTAREMGGDLLRCVPSGARFN